MANVLDLDQLPKLDLRKKHTIEVVVDRSKCERICNNVLAESFETALHLTDGLVSIAQMDNQIF